MIRKMKSLTSNNSLINIKESRSSVKRINNLSNRIKSLQNDIDRINNSKKKNDNIQYHKIELEKNSSMINNNSNIINNKKNKFIINKTFVKNPYYFKENKKHIKYRTNNNSQRKNNSKKIPKENNFIYKKIGTNNFKKIIHQKKNIFLNINSNFNNDEKQKRIKRDISESNYLNEFYSQSYNLNKLNPLLSNATINKNVKENTKEEQEENTESNLSNNLLDIEFELRCLNKRMKLAMKKRKELKEKLIVIQNQNNNIKNNIIKEQNKINDIINNLILFNKEYSLNKNQNESENCEENINYQNNKLLMKDIIFNLMDIKFEYENNILYNKFIEGLNELLSSIPILSINNSGNNIANKINRLLHLKNKLKNLEEKYSNKNTDNEHYDIYFTSLLNELNLKSFEELKEYIKSLFLKNIQENKRMREITNALIDDSFFPEQKEQSPRIKYINNANNINRKEKNANFKIKNKNKSSNNLNLNNGFRNKRRKSLHFHGLCYNSFLHTNNKRNFFNTKINKKYFRSGIINNNESSQFNYFNHDDENENDIYLLKEEEKN